MGYEAFVACTCYARGLTTPPPYPAFVVSDEHGTRLQLPDDLWEKEPSLCWAKYEAFNTWKSRACVHPGMDAANERLATVLGMEAFCSLVEEQGGAARYPVLSEQLPEYNEGSMPASYAPALLLELDALAAGPDQTLVVLREQMTGDIVYTVIAGTQKLFMSAAYGRYEYGLDEEGFFVMEKTGEQLGQAADYTTRFRSSSFSQQCLEKERFCFNDLSDGQSFECVMGLRLNGIEVAETATFSLTREIVPLAQVYDIIVPLRTLAEAAIATGHPICWT